LIYFAFIWCLIL